MDIYLKAWGQGWPHHKGKVSSDEIHILVGEDLDFMYLDGIELPEYLEYICPDNLRQVSETLSCPIGTDVVVIRSEYETLRDYLDKEVNFGRKRPAFIMKGRPGIGKSTFLLYLLLYRLERVLPTAFQFSAECYLIFDARGAQVYHCNGDYNRYDQLQDCWALINLTEKDK